MITSTKNPKIQHLRGLQSRAKARSEAGAFVVEGVRLAEEALASGWTARSALFTNELNERGRKLITELQERGAAIEEVSPEVMQVVSDTESPQGILLEIESRQQPLPDLLDFVLILDGVSDPGNLGTLLRSAAAVAASAVLVGPGSADLFSPKVLRSGMGAQFRLALQAATWDQIGAICKKNKLQLFVAEANEGAAYDRVDMQQPLALIIGGEAHGASPEAQSLRPMPIQIPMPGQTESLNAAIAGSLLLFEALRQRRNKK
jgi:TrmH family RNA methyltransferase